MFAIAFVRGERGMMIKAAAESGVGHVRIVPQGWTETRDSDLRLIDWKQTNEILLETEGIKVIAPRIRKEAMLAFGTRMVVTGVLGTDPKVEPAANRLVQNITEGAYLTSDQPGTTVIGKAIADRLDVELDDDLMITAAAGDGQIAGAMLRIVGIIDTGSKEMDLSICHVSINDLESLIGIEGVGELTMIIDDARDLEETEEKLKSKLSDNNEIVTWKQIMPELAAGAKIDETWTNIIVAVIMTVVFLGIASAQLAAVLERRREFAVLAAIGMKNHRLVMIMIIEGIVLGMFGAVVGLILGLSSSYYVYKHGIDFSKLYGEMELTVSNVLLDPVFHGDFGWWLVPLAFVLALSATVLSSLYPAWYAVRTEAADALRVEQ